MVHGALPGLFGFDIFSDEEVGHLIEAVAEPFNLFICKIPFAEVLFAFLNREHGNPLTQCAPGSVSSGSLCRFWEVSTYMSTRLRIFLSSC